MSATLEFYSIKLSDLPAVIGSNNLRLLRPILENSEADFNEIFEAEDFEGGPDIESGLERWIQGAVGDGREDAPFTVEQLGDTLGFITLLRFFGTSVGRLNHSVASGDLFRLELLSNVAQSLLDPPFPLERLISRPIAGYQRLGIPTWGGMTADELATIAPKLTQDAPIWPKDTRIDRWLNELWNVLGSAADMGNDLVTFYI